MCQNSLGFLFFVVISIIHYIFGSLDSYVELRVNMVRTSQIARRTTGGLCPPMHVTKIARKRVLLTGAVKKSMRRENDRYR